MGFIRLVLGKLILFFDFITRPKPLEREIYAQKKIDYITTSLSLYQFNSCPFCVKVRRQMRRLSLNIELRDAKNDSSFKKELITAGGKYKVPCLRIDHKNKKTEWLYGSNEINIYLQSNFQYTSN